MPFPFPGMPNPWDPNYWSNVQNQNLMSLMAIAGSRADPRYASPTTVQYDLPIPNWAKQAGLPQQVGATFQNLIGPSQIPEVMEASRDIRSMPIPQAPDTSGMAAGVRDVGAETMGMARGAPAPTPGGTPEAQAARNLLLRQASGAMGPNALNQAAEKYALDAVRGTPPSSTEDPAITAYRSSTEPGFRHDVADVMDAARARSEFRRQGRGGSGGLGEGGGVVAADSADAAALLRAARPTLDLRERDIAERAWQLPAEERARRERLAIASPGLQREFQNLSLDLSRDLRGAGGQRFGEEQQQFINQMSRAEALDALNRGQITLQDFLGNQQFHNKLAGGEQRLERAKASVGVVEDEANRMLARGGLGLNYYRGLFGEPVRFGLSPSEQDQASLSDPAYTGSPYDPATGAFQGWGGGGATGGTSDISDWLQSVQGGVTPLDLGGGAPPDIGGFLTPSGTSADTPPDIGGFLTPSGQSADTLPTSTLQGGGGPIDNTYWPYGGGPTGMGVTAGGATLSAGGGPPTRIGPGLDGQPPVDQSGNYYSVYGPDDVSQLPTPSDTAPLGDLGYPDTGGYPQFGPARDLIGGGPLGGPPESELGTQFGTPPDSTSFYPGPEGGVPFDMADPGGAKLSQLRSPMLMDQGNLTGGDTTMARYGYRQPPTSPVGDGGFIHAGPGLESGLPPLSWGAATPPSRGFGGPPTQVGPGLGSQAAPGSRMGGDAGAINPATGEPWYRSQTGRGTGNVGSIFDASGNVIESLVRPPADGGTPPSPSLPPRDFSVGPTNAYSGPTPNIDYGPVMDSQGNYLTHEQSMNQQGAGGSAAAGPGGGGFVRGFQSGQGYDATPPRRGGGGGPSPWEGLGGGAYGSFQPPGSRGPFGSNGAPPPEANVGGGAFQSPGQGIDPNMLGLGVRAIPNTGGGAFQPPGGLDRRNMIYGVRAIPGAPPPRVGGGGPPARIGPGGGFGIAGTPGLTQSRVRRQRGVPFGGGGGWQRNTGRMAGPGYGPRPQPRRRRGAPGFATPPAIR